jgi:hypothetical protein
MCCTLRRASCYHPPFTGFDRQLGETVGKAGSRHRRSTMWIDGSAKGHAPRRMAGGMIAATSTTGLIAMNKRFPLLMLTLVLALPNAVLAQQHGSGVAAPPPTSAPAEAKQFDFLIGQWELEVKPKVNSLAAMIHGAPKLVGSWKAWRGFDGFGVEDELRVVDASGNPMSLNQALRVYDRNQNRWTIVGLDVYRARVSNSTAQWQGGEMRIDGTGTDNEGKPYLSRTRYFGIAPDAFRMQQDRSSDNGQTWDEATLVIEARRVAGTATR